MLIKTFEVGHIGTNCYLVTDENTLETAVIDPGDESQMILDYMEDNKLQARAILITHGHHDHTLAAESISLETGAPVYMHRLDAGDHPQYQYAGTTRHYGDGHQVQVGGLVFQVMETPGHSPGGVTLLCENCLFTGDTLFRDSCGRADLLGGDMDILMDSLRKLNALEGNYEVYPGHMDSTDLERERRFNHYLRYAINSGR